MTRIIKLRHGLDINLAGKAETVKRSCSGGKVFSLMPCCFEGVKPKVVVKEGDRVKAGDALFVNKDFPEVGFASPVSGSAWWSAASAARCSASAWRLTNSRSMPISA